MDKDEGIVGIERGLWIRLARSQLRRRLHYCGEEARVCDGCREILLCDGPISFQLCRALDDMVVSGHIEISPPKTTFKKMRSRYLPISTHCLAAYKFYTDHGKVRFRHKRLPQSTPQTPTNNPTTN